MFFGGVHSVFALRVALWVSGDARRGEHVARPQFQMSVSLGALYSPLGPCCSSRNSLTWPSVLRTSTTMITTKLTRHAAARRYSETLMIHDREVAGRTGHAKE